MEIGEKPDERKANIATAEWCIYLWEDGGIRPLCTVTEWGRGRDDQQDKVGCGEIQSGRGLAGVPGLEAPGSTQIYLQNEQLILTANKY